MGQTASSRLRRVLDSFPPGMQICGFQYQEWYVAKRKVEDGEAATAKAEIEAEIEAEIKTAIDKVCH